MRAMGVADEVLGLFATQGSNSYTEQVTMEEHACQAAALARAEGASDARVLAALDGQLRPEMVEAVRRCSANLATALLTNNIEPIDEGTHSPEHDEVVGLFDVIVQSSVVGCRKPEPRFYEIACQQLGVTPSSCVFLDDLGINLKPARAMGMATIKVFDPAQALTELAVLVGFPLG